MSRIRIAIVGVGNCASALVQGIAYYTKLAQVGEPLVGLAHPYIGPYGIDDLEIVAAFDIDRRKVGQPIHRAVFAPPNNTQVFHPDLPPSDVIVQPGPLLDGVPKHMAHYPADRRFDPTDAPPVDVARVLRDSGAEILINYLPVGAQQATEHYAAACLEAGVSLVNCIPVFIASDPQWADRFCDARIPIVGDDIKAQVGATIVHRALARLMDQRGAVIDSTYQLNTAGNTDFLNMLDHSRLSSKRISKTDAVQSQLDVPLEADRIHIGPSDYIPFQKDNKVCFLRIDARGFGGVPLNVELRLSVEDSPNSGGVVVDAVRCCRLARDAGLAGPVDAISAWTMKHPPRQMNDPDALRGVEQFIAETSRSVG